MKTLKSIFLLFFIVVAAVNGVVAQDVMDEIAQKCCECISMGDSSLNKNELQMKLGLCMIREAMPYKKELKRSIAWIWTVWMPKKAGHWGNW
jgi:hypothetical protein